ncbi:hypothetical protein PI95_032790 [Hassallia byssoidea VB512170]|uniref:Uncharacterized protein n=1 Tax=Hassallia byssoidea VB512170 TaxID=1304833 RepID=A0A846HN89_9CYAN|nr:hypothetical protein [Hassalia byssoidea]NEU77151.1 hypothetical protein [Hassalia byssoidea VB512170]
MGDGVNPYLSVYLKALHKGLLNTAIAIGAGLSNLLAGVVVNKIGSNSAFLMLAAVFWFVVPETKVKSSHMPSEVVEKKV